MSDIKKDPRLEVVGEAILLISTQLDREPVVIAIPSILRESEGPILTRVGRAD